jgi:hypothetical protein
MAHVHLQYAVAAAAGHALAIGAPVHRKHLYKNKHSVRQARTTRCGCASG